VQVFMRRGVGITNKQDKPAEEPAKEESQNGEVQAENNVSILH
jgi:hypothetical protein